MIDRKRRAPTTDVDSEGRPITLGSDGRGLAGAELEAAIEGLARSHPDLVARFIRLPDGTRAPAIRRGILTKTEAAALAREVRAARFAWHVRRVGALGADGQLTNNQIGRLIADEEAQAADPAPARVTPYHAKTVARWRRLALLQEGPERP